MFCNQCEQTLQGTGCEKIGVCGKDETVAALQDLLVHVSKGISMYAHRAAGLGMQDPEIDHFVIQALFTTVTNVDFDEVRMQTILHEAATMLNRARDLYTEACQKKGVTPDTLTGPATIELAQDISALCKQGEAVSITVRAERNDPDALSLQETITYGLKGAAAYLDHAHVLGQNDAALYAQYHETLDFLATESQSIEELAAWALKTGAINLRTMELLDAGNTGTYGHPEPSTVRIHPLKGKAILISGHDLKDLAILLEQTAGKGINIYTHGEMLPAHGYPELKKHPHLVGNYGGAWQDQIEEFSAFPGSILMTTNCIRKPRSSYLKRIFTTGLVAWPGVVHIGEENGTKDFSAVIDAALAADGFAEDGADQVIPVGFAHKTVLGVADKVLGAVQAGDIKHIFLVGGCDSGTDGRGYFTDFVEQIPNDCLIMTLGCGKYRFNKMELGEIGGLPRLLDAGQCNDAYSAVQIALGLASALDCGVNDLPLSLVISWFEQKAVAVLLTLLHLGVKNIRLGPDLPAFISPNVLAFLVENFDLKPTTTPEADLDAILGVKAS